MEQYEPRRGHSRLYDGYCNRTGGWHNNDTLYGSGLQLAGGGNGYANTRLNNGYINRLFGFDDDFVQLACGRVMEQQQYIDSICRFNDRHSNRQLTGHGNDNI